MPSDFGQFWRVETESDCYLLVRRDFRLTKPKLPKLYKEICTIMDNKLLMTEITQKRQEPENKIVSDNFGV